MSSVPVRTARDSERNAARVGEHLHVAAEGAALARVLQVVVGLGAGSDAVGGCQCAVQTQEGQPGGVCAVEKPMQVRNLRGDGVQALM